jgi:hypothetical protein
MTNPQENGEAYRTETEQIRDDVREIRESVEEIRELLSPLAQLLPTFLPRLSGMATISRAFRRTP